MTRQEDSSKKSSQERIEQYLLEVEELGFGSLKEERLTAALREALKDCLAIAAETYDESTIWRIADILEGKK